MTYRNTIVGVAGDVHQPAANTAAVVTYSATAGAKHAIGMIFASYSATPTGGLLTITDDGATIFALQIAAAGPVVVDLSDYPIVASVANKAMVVTLAAGGGSVVGALTVRHWLE